MSKPTPSRTPDALRPPELSSGQKLMVFVLSMTLFGLANIVTEVLPEISIGPVELSVSYLAFVPVVMVSLFNPLYAALGAPLGEIVFVDLLMGDFSGIGELEGYLQMFLGLYIGGCLVRDPRRRPQLLLAALATVTVDKMLSAVVDIGKVWVGVEDAEYVEGLPQSILLLEGIGFSTDLIISGVLFGALPAMVLAPRLYGKIEPLLGLAPRDPRNPVPLAQRGTAAFALLAIVLSFVSMIAAFTSEIVDNFGVWEPGFIDQYGQRFLWIGVSAALIVLVAAVAATRFVLRSRRERSAQDAGTETEAAEDAPAGSDPR
ncbi:cell division protein FtsQ [Nocardiopsis sp. NRRL B-16309]|uniref:cell division protein FtsQ n=1 Tax=Nocardiopsis sp. NRRL B-16309 TaxID=1519494 RepID=UPI0006BFFCD0|nr:cell division protein FtsQ [Nocardiopsis sp. NRRL B-16309]KOX10828.1 cell division protein FtsQ [Nocardiopsis sp. NRRL B-16309]